MGNERLDAFLTLVLSLPTILFTIVLLVSFLYWLVVALGMTDIELFDLGDGDSDASAALGLLSRFGLDGVPLTIVVTFLAFFGWFISSFVAFFSNQILFNVWLQLIASVPLFFIELYLAAIITGFLIRPLKPVFAATNQNIQKTIIGQTAVVRSGQVSTEFGEAELNDGGAGLIIKVRSLNEGDVFKKGDRIVLLEYSLEEQVYRVISEQDFKN